MIDDEVNIVMAYVYEENGMDYVEVLNDQEEINYVYSLLDEIEGE